MQEAFPDENDNRRKDIIVAESPLLRSFIDKYLDNDPEMWIKMVDKVFLAKRDEMIDILGDELVDRDLNVYFQLAKENGIFSKDTENETKFALIACFAWIGYEIGNARDVDLFVDDVLTQIYRFDNVKQRPETADYVAEVMSCGAMWRKEVAEDAPREFREFFDKLDF